MINKVILVGRVGKIGPDTFTKFDSGTCVNKFSLATSNKWYDKANREYKEDTTWHTIETWSHTAKFCRDYVNVGDALYVEGSIKVSSYEKDGEKKTFITVLSQKIQKIASSSKGQGAAREIGKADNDIPF